MDSMDSTEDGAERIATAILDLYTKLVPGRREKHPVMEAVELAVTVFDPSAEPYSDFELHRAWGNVSGEYYAQVIEG
jgi:hypothetical protein